MPKYTKFIQYSDPNTGITHRHRVVFLRKGNIYCLVFLQKQTNNHLTPLVPSLPILLGTRMISEMIIWQITSYFHYQVSPVCTWYVLFSCSICEIWYLKSNTKSTMDHNRIEDKMKLQYFPPKKWEVGKVWFIPEIFEC